MRNAAYRVPGHRQCDGVGKVTLFAWRKTRLKPRFRSITARHILTSGSEVWYGAEAAHRSAPKKEHLDET